MSDVLRVVVIGGGTSSEHEVSRASAAAIAAALDPARFEVVELTIRPDGSWAGPGGTDLPGDLAGAVAVLERADVAIPALHGPRGEDGTVAALLDLVGIPYVGSGIAAGSLAMGKHATKLLAASVGVATASGVLVREAHDAQAGTLELPVVVKPDRGGSSHGASVVREAADLAPAIAAALAFGPEALVESFVEAREIDLAVLEHPDGSLECLPPLEILVPEGDIFDADAKYAREPDFRIPAPVDDVLGARLRDAALTMFRAIGARGLARIDFFVTGDEVVLNEINTFPGFTPRSQVPRMAASAGRSYAELVEQLVATALARSEPHRVRRRLGASPRLSGTAATA